MEAEWGEQKKMGEMVAVGQVAGICPTPFSTVDTQSANASPQGNGWHADYSCAVAVCREAACYIHTIGFWIPLPRRLEFTQNQH